MTMQDKLKGYLGLAARAGRVQSGADTIEKTVRSGGARRLLLDERAGRNTADRLKRLSEYYSITLTTVPELGQAIGKPGRMAAVLTDEGFDAAIEELLNENRGGVNKE